MNRVSCPTCTFLGILAVLALPGALSAQIGTVDAEQKISETAGGFGGVLDTGDNFGIAVAALGDLDGDGVGDLAVGASGTDGNGTDPGGVWILFMNADGTVASQQEISYNTGGLGPVLNPGDMFGSSVAALGDLDGDGVEDLAVGALGADDGGTDQGAVWILFLNADGTVATKQKIAEGTGGFGGVLSTGGLFGGACAALGDLDGDDVCDLAVGNHRDDDGDTDQGAVWILFLNADGTVAAEQKISETAGGFVGPLNSVDRFGGDICALGDLDEDGNADLAVVAHGDDVGGTDQGAVWILFLNADGTVASEQKISESTGGFGGDLDPGDVFGGAIAALGDLDGNGTSELAVGAQLDDDGLADQGAMWILFLDADGTVGSEQKISETEGGFGGDLDMNDRFGCSAAALGDLDSDGVPDLAVGALLDDDGVVDQGALWILFLEIPDAISPELSCPTLVSVLDPKGGPPGEVVNFTVTASDNLDPTPSVVCVPPSGSVFPRGTTIVTCTATDESGNQSVCMFPVVVAPTIRPRQL
jgi:hypothetical protein